MEWIQVTITTSPDGIEPLSGRLYQIGISGLEIEDQQDFLDFLEDHKQQWDYVDDELLQAKNKETCIKIYLSDNASGHDTLGLVRESVNALKSLDADNKFGSLEISLNNIDEEDWANNWKKYFKPIEVGESILIKPEWCEVENTDRIIFEVNPGMTFGTGTHETTRMCIKELEKYVSEGVSVLDLGCGSGILSIISLLLEADKAVAADIDPNCKKIAYANAKMNDVNTKKYNVFAGNILEDRRLKAKLGTGHGVVVANIVADVIIPLCDDIKRYLKPDGVFICSGIIDFREADVWTALRRNNMEVINRRSEGEWVCLTASLIQEILL